jgi:hypothetical protein
VLAWIAAVAVFSAALLLLKAHPVFANLVRLIVLSRYGVLTGLLLVGLVPLRLQAAPSLLANLFVLRSARHLFHIAWLAVLDAHQSAEGGHRSSLASHRRSRQSR